MEGKISSQEGNLKLWQVWKSLTKKSKVLLLFLVAFALAGFAVVGAWALYKIGITNNAGSIDKNNRYLADYHEQYTVSDSADFESSVQNFVNISLLNKLYPVNAQLIFDAAKDCDDPNSVDRMLYALNLYLKDDPQGENYKKMVDEVQAVIAKYHPKSSNLNAITWMNDPGWNTLKRALIGDTAVLRRAAEATGVDARLIVACTVGEQIRLFNSKREDYKRYLGPAILMVEQQFSYGVTGVKLETAAKIENNLKDSLSPFYMGKAYEHLLDFETEDIETERIERFTNFRNHYYSFVYAGCILRQIMLQWKRAGYDISDRPDILCTLYNLGFSVSKPKPDPCCGGSRVKVGDEVYTFGVLGNDFFYSGELQEYYPLPSKTFAD